MKVHEVVDIDEDHLTIKEEENEYWANCADFYEKVKDRDWESLTESQQQYLIKIQDDLARL